MNRKASALATVCSLLALSAFVFGQVPQTKPVPPASNIIGPQLIVWSQQQAPRPMTQSLPSPQAQQKEPVQATSFPSQPLQKQTFTGTIMKDGSEYVLKNSGGKISQLDDQDNIKQYEGKSVKIDGNLDRSNTIHVASIQLIS